MARQRNTEPVGDAAWSDYPNYGYAPGAPPERRHEVTYRKNWIAAWTAAFGTIWVGWCSLIAMEAWFHLGLFNWRDPFVPGIGIAAATGFAVTLSRWLEVRHR